MWTLLLLSSCIWLPASTQALWWGASPGPNRLNIVNALTDFVPAIFRAQRASTPRQEDRSDRKHFDFIIVGAGAAGSALARRLTERYDWTVLLLEAGGEEVPVNTIPFFLGQFHSTDANWQFVTTPQTTSCAGLSGSRCDFPQGRSLGGSTVINYMFNIRGNRRDFDHWVKMGNKGWSWDEVLPYFKKAEDLRIPELQNRENRGYGGRIRTTYTPYFSGMGKLLLQGAREAGFPTPDDYNAGEQAGMNRIQSTTYNGARWSANPGYLRRARRRPNLFLRTRSLATRLVLEGGRARGVRYLRGGQEFEAFASKEVLVCAGAVNSPALLMRSGIGPRDHLRELGIPLVKDLPVGYNMMEHTAIIGTFGTLNESVAPDISDILLSPKTQMDYFTRRSGPLTSTGTFEVISFHDLKGTPHHTPNWPIVEMLHSSISPAINPKFAGLFRVPLNVYNLYLKQLENRPAFMACIFSLRPKSRGRVTLENPDPETPPLIDPRAFSHPDDVEVVLAGIREYQRILASPSFQRVGARLIQATDPGFPKCERHTFDSDDYWRCLIREATATLYHPCGTCKMAPPGDPTGVVTPDLKVVGIEGLRVVDVSITPQIISGHFQMTAYMIAEKMADVLKSKYPQENVI